MAKRILLVGSLMCVWAVLAPAQDCLDYGDLVNLVATLEMSTTIHYDQLISDGIAYVVADGTLYLIDVSNAAQPKHISSLSLGGWGGDIVLSDGIAYIVGRFFGLRVVDVSNPSAPVLISSLEIIPQTEVFDLDKLGDYVYLVDQSRVLTIDVSEPTSPFFCGVHYLLEPRCIKVQKDLAYVGTNNGMYVFDLTNPAEIQQVGNCLTMAIPNFTMGWPRLSRPRCSLG